jgi:hypothetical protein
MVVAANPEAVAMPAMYAVGIDNTSRPYVTVHLWPQRGVAAYPTLVKWPLVAKKPQCLHNNPLGSGVILCTKV